MTKTWYFGIQFKVFQTKINVWGVCVCVCSFLKWVHFTSRWYEIPFEVVQGKGNENSCGTHKHSDLRRKDIS